jgi:hypothetical protein
MAAPLPAGDADDDADAGLEVFEAAGASGPRLSASPLAPQAAVKSAQSIRRADRLFMKPL